MHKDIVQSILFDKNKVNIQEAVDWLREHGYKHNNIDETNNKIRFRQTQPKHGVKTRILHLNDKIEFVLEFPHEK